MGKWLRARTSYPVLNHTGAPAAGLVWARLGHGKGASQGLLHLLSRANLWNIKGATQGLLHLLSSADSWPVDELLFSCRRLLRCPSPMPVHHAE